MLMMRFSCPLCTLPSSKPDLCWRCRRALKPQPPYKRKTVYGPVRRGNTGKRRHDITPAHVMQLINGGMSVRQVAVHFGVNFAVIRLRITEAKRLVP